MDFQWHTIDQVKIFSKKEKQRVLHYKVLIMAPPENKGGRCGSVIERRTPEQEVQGSNTTTAV